MHAPTFDAIEYEVGDQIATIFLNRPDRLNGFTIAMADELVAALDLADADDEVRVIVVTGRGRAFCAGADLAPSGATFKAPDGDPPPDATSEPRRPRRFHDPGGLVTLRMYESSKPIIAAINGPAVGVGLTMTLAADVRLAAAGAKLGFVFAGRGVAPDAGSSWFLNRLVGMGRALEWCLTARVFRSEEALEAGLVQHVYDADEVYPEALALAAEMRDNTAPLSATLTRQLMWRMTGADPYQAHERESLALLDLGRSDEAIEGVRAFLARRPAEWKAAVPRDLPDWYPWWDLPESTPTAVRAHRSGSAMSG